MVGEKDAKKEFNPKSPSKRYKYGRQSVLDTREELKDLYAEPSAQGTVWIFVERRRDRGDHSVNVGVFVGQIVVNVEQRVRRPMSSTSTSDMASREQRYGPAGQKNEPYAHARRTMTRRFCSKTE
jgi:hypothetical protein